MQLQNYILGRCNGMATSSIINNFIISGAKQVELFADAIEKSENNRLVRILVSAKQIKGKEQLKKFMETRKKANVDKR